MRVEFLKQPHEQQQIALDRDEHEQLFGGAKRGGKSVWLCQKIALLSHMFPGNRILLARRVLGDLKSSTLDEFFRTVPEELAWKGSWEQAHNKGDKIIKIATTNPRVPSEILYRGLGNMTQKEVDKIKSLTLGAIAIDEPSEIYEQTYLQLLAQLTHILPDGSRPPYMAMLACNPEPGWVKKRFITNRVPNSVFIPSLPRHNPHLPEGWEQKLRDGGFDQDWIDKYLGGSWDVSEGTVFTMYNEKIHTISQDDLFRMCHCELRCANLMTLVKKHLKLIAAIDHAMTGVTAMVLVGVDRDGNEFILKEYYEKGQIISEHARAMKTIFFEYGWPSTILIDPSTISKSLQGTNELESVQNEYQKHGINTVLAYNKIEVGINSIKEMMVPMPLHHHPLTGELGAPAVYLVRETTWNLRREIEEFRKELKAHGNGVEWVGSDHALDCYRYIRNSRPRRPQLVDGDMMRLPLQQRHAIRSHNNWAKKFDAQAKARPRNYFRGGKL